MSNDCAIVFPGQGSQSVGMLSDLVEAFPSIRETFTEASEAVSMDLWQLASVGPAETLNQTENTQPALLTASVAIWRLVADTLQPQIIAGHSLGEYSALVAAGALTLADGVKLVRERGRLMQQAVPVGEGAMAAVLGLDDDQIESICSEVVGVVSAANFNAPGQVVIAGAAAAVQAAADACKAGGAKRALMLDVSVPSHCALMTPAADAFADLLQDAELKTPSIRVVHNVDAAEAADLDALRTKLVAQLDHPVRWTQCVQALQAAGAAKVYECGPGSVLSGLVKRIDRGLAPQSLSTASVLAEVLA